LAVTMLFAGSPGLVGAVDYYVSPAGNDTNPGTPQAMAWATVQAVNIKRFVPGDRILFQGGATFANADGIYLDDQDSGTAASPVVVSSFGTGRAVIAPSANLGFYGYNVQGVEVHD